MAYPKLLSLSDHELTLELTNAVRALHATRTEFNAQRGSISDEGWDLLYRNLLESEKYLRFCLAEKSRREAAASFQPKKPRRQRTLVKKHPPMPPPPAEPTPGPQPAVRAWQEPTDPSVIVYEPNGPRRWRKGDPIY